METRCFAKHAGLAVKTSDRGDQRWLRAAKSATERTNLIALHRRRANDSLRLGRRSEQSRRILSASVDFPLSTLRAAARAKT